MVLVFICGCAPSYRLSTADQFTQNLGLTHQFSISRWHTRILPAESNILIAVKAEKPEDSQIISDVVAEGLSPFFSMTTATGHSQLLADAATEARQRDCHFLFYIDIVDSHSFALFSEESESGRESGYKNLQLILSVVDLGGGRIVDKIRLSASSSRLNVVGVELSSLLARPLSEIGHNLTGV